MNIAKLNTVSLDDKTYIIKRGTSGGGTPDTPSGSSWRYFDFSNMTLTGVQSYSIKALLAMVGKFDLEGQKMIGATTTLVIEGGRDLMANCIAGAIETSAKTNGEGVLMDWNSYLAAIGLNDSGLADMGITEITKEQFYSIE